MSARVFHDRGAPVRAPFATTLRNRFAATAVGLDFRSDLAGSERAIAEWTGDSVQLGAATRAVVVTRVRFEARWAYPFEASRTSAGAFHTLDGRVVQAQMMSRPGELPYAEIEGARAIALRYAGPFELVLVRASGDGSLESLSADRLDALTAALERRSVALSVPRFAIGPTTHSLGAHLRALGLERPFSLADADFGRLAESEEPLALGEVIQGGRIEVDEEGTRAEATTTARVVAASAPVDPVVLRFDRPFLFLLRDTDSGLVLFLGRVGDPTSG